MQSHVPGTYTRHATAANQCKTLMLVAEFELRMVHEFGDLNLVPLQVLCGIT
jgi:hypothetical protein